MFKKSALIAAGGALALVGALAFAAPAFASPTPDPDPAVTITNVTADVVLLPARNVHVQYNWVLTDDTHVGDVIVEVTTYDNCGAPTVTDTDEQLPIEPVPGSIAASSLYVAIPATGYVKVQLFASNGGGAPLVSTAVFATDPATPVVAGDVVASFTPDPAPTTGTFLANTGNQAGVVHYQLFDNGVASGAPVAADGCSTFSGTYSGAAGDVITLHIAESNVDAATVTIPAAVVAPPAGAPAPAAPAAADPALASTGVNAAPPLILAGALVFAGLTFLLVLWIRRREAR
ncbi:MAG: hypothetical protein JWN80_785 [Microbacteriaceae bacterium]|nr:hypothetical protein [Microbacteriaceae bacterium]